MQREANMKAGNFVQPQITKIPKKLSWSKKKEFWDNFVSGGWVNAYFI